MVSVEHVARLFAQYDEGIRRMTNDEISKRAGFKSGNVVAMIRQGSMKLPVSRVRSLAAITGIPVRPLMRAALRDRNEAEWVEISAVFGLADSEE